MQFSSERNPKSAFRNSKFIWYRRRDSNPHCLVPKTSASSQLGYAGKSKDEGGGMRDESLFHPLSFIPHLVDPARFERATSTFAESQSANDWRRRQESNLHTTERGDLANRCHTVRRRLRVCPKSQVQRPMSASRYLTLDVGLWTLN